MRNDSNAEDDSPRPQPSFTSKFPSSTVFLNVYDITPYNAPLLYEWGIGVHHTAIEVHGIEIAFGRCLRGSGVFECVAKRCPGHTFREQLVLGTTPYSEGEVVQWLHWLQDEGAARQHHDEATSRFSYHDVEDPNTPNSPRSVTSHSVSRSYQDPNDPCYWLGSQYHLLRNNCNHFAQYAASKLLPCLPSPPFGSTTEPAVTVCRGLPSDVERYITGCREYVDVPLTATGGTSSRPPPLTLASASDEVVTSSTRSIRYEVDTLIPLWVNRLASLGCRHLPTEWVEKLEALDRAAQGM